MYELPAEELNACRERLEELRACLNVDAAKGRISELEQTMTLSNFWEDVEVAQETVQTLKALKGVVTAPEDIEQELSDVEILVELAEEAEDASMEAEIEAALDSVRARLGRLEIESLFSDPRDAKTALVSIHPGAGGTESCDWAEMLYRMLLRFCERREYTVDVLEYQPGEEAGLKSATFRVSGHNVYGNLKSEEGVHRLVRISPFDSAKRRHTSFAAIEVLTEVDEDIEVEVREDELKMDVFRSSGAGGQKVNKTSSAVRLTHLPTGIVVACQIERSQHRNKATALDMLKAKLYDIEMKKQEAELAAQREGQQEVAWGSQIRSYVLHPYQMIKDHRTNEETGNVDRVLDGDLDRFVEAYLKWKLGLKSKN